MDEDDIFECVEVLNVCVLEDIYNSCGFFFCQTVWVFIFQLHISDT